MQIFLVEYYERTDLKPGHSNFPALGGGDTEHVEANSRIEAFIDFYNRFKTDTKNITVEATKGGNPLGFTDKEVQQLQNEGIELEVGSKIKHIHIKSIKEA